MRKTFKGKEVEVRVKKEESEVRGEKLRDKKGEKRKIISKRRGSEWKIEEYICVFLKILVYVLMLV